MSEDNGTAAVTPSGFGSRELAIVVCLALAVFIAVGLMAMGFVSRRSVALASSGGLPVAAYSSGPELPALDWRRVGGSVQGRPILMASFGSGKRRMLVIGGIHGSEFGAGVAEQFASCLNANPAAVPAGVRVDVVACANPDGRAANKKGNADAVNLNGNFPTKNWKPQQYLTTTAGPRAGSEPETQAIMRLLKARYVRVISLHSQGGFVDYDGPDGVELASRVASAAGLPVKKLGPVAMYAGSLGTYVPERYGIPVITVELTSREMTPMVLAGLLAAVR